jgi:hypothetical protein
VKTGWLVRAGGLAACAAFLFSAAGSGLGPAEAASSSTRATKPAAALATTAGAARTAAQEPQATSSVETAADADNCLRSRKRLWVEGEGWVVRRVTTCF